MANEKYRMYVDESGTANYPNASLSAALNKRYLSLIGIIISEDEHHNVLEPAINELKYLLTNDYDEKFPLHRKDIKERQGIYSKLRDSATEKKWNFVVKNMIQNTDYKIICVVIDKPWHEAHYASPNHPYYYCMEILLERYVRFLDSIDSRGDVMFESRGGKEDNESKKQYRRIYDYGTGFVGVNMIQKRLTSKDLKLKNKKDCIGGLEFADMLSLATELDTLKLYGKGGAINSEFTKEVVEWIQGKYYYGGKKGYGRKLLS